MTGAEKGFLLLCSHLGNPGRQVLTTAQFRTLTDRVQHAAASQEDREVALPDLLSLGYSRDMAARILSLLSEEELLTHYLRQGARLDCVPVTRITKQYPRMLRQRLGLDSPSTFWAKGDLTLLNTPAISLVGSRELHPQNHSFAEAVGYHAAKQGLTLVSGNARGADRAAQEACLKAGGKVISIVADELWKHHSRENILYLSEEDYDSPFTAQRALSRNRCIHALGNMVFVAQSDLHKGGTWDGTAKNLHFGWSPVLCFRDGSEAARELEQLGAYLIDAKDLKDFGSLPESELSFL